MIRDGMRCQERSSFNATYSNASPTNDLQKDGSKTVRGARIEVDARVEIRIDLTSS
jgi:hypothetical protein